MNYAEVYGKMHRKPKQFSGYSIKHYVKDIAALVRKHDALTLLDYGCGKGYQYLERRVHENWGGILPHCYDPGVPQLSMVPRGPFCGVICTDVMEHIETDDVPTILADVFSLATKFVFLGISCRPAARKTLPDGRDVHLTVKPEGWWLERIAEVNRSTGVELDIGVKFEA